MDYGIIGKKNIFFVLFSLQSISRIISVSSPSNILLTLLLYWNLVYYWMMHFYYTIWLF